MHGRQEGRLRGRKEILQGLQTASRVAGLCEQLHPQTTTAMPAERGTKGTEKWPGCHPAGHLNCLGSDKLFLRLPVTPWGCQWAVTGIPCSQACSWASCQKQSPASVSKHKVNRRVSSVSTPSMGPLSSSSEGSWPAATWALPSGLGRRGPPRHRRAGQLCSTVYPPWHHRRSLTFQPVHVAAHSRTRWRRLRSHFQLLRMGIRWGGFPLPQGLSCWQPSEPSRHALAWESEERVWEQGRTGAEPTPGISKVLLCSPAYKDLCPCDNTIDEE